jgi:hypothetical protein
MGLVFLVMIPLMILLRDPKKNRGVTATSIHQADAAKFSKEASAELVHP